LSIDYTHDAAAENFFGTYPLAKAALEKAVTDLEAVITSQPVALTNDFFEASSGDVSLALDLDLKYTNPSNGFEHTIGIPFIEHGTVVIHVGSQPLTGTTQAFSSLGTAKVTVIALGDDPGALQDAMNTAAASAEAEWIRSPGPIFNMLSGPVDIGGNPVNFTIQLGATHSQLWFDTDTNNDGDPDTATQLQNYWHFDPNTAPPPGKYDFYSIALHELVHSLGFGTARSFMLNVGGTPSLTTWLGPEAQALNGGSMFGLVAGDLQHLVEGFQSARLSDGLLQDVVMDGTIGPGVRKELTQMDLAFLRDMGWETVPIAVPEPGSLALCGLLLALRRRRRE
jgi:hypothetical protein